MKSIYAVKDRAIDAFATPFVLISNNQALRSFRDEVNNKSGNSAIAQHPDDYDLYLVGHWDEEKGLVTGQAPEIVARGKDLVDEEQS